MTDKLEIEYRRLCDLKQLKGNSKKHATENTIASILELGFKDPIGYDPSLNGGKGGITEGHDRCAALLAIKKRKIDRPRGIDIDNDGEWMVPVLVGVHAKNEAQAIKYSIIHNHSTIHGAGLDLATELKLFDSDLLISQAEYLDEEGENLGVIGDLNSILEALNTSDNLDDSEEDIDYSILDDEDLAERLREMSDGVKKAIQIEFESDHYEEAYELVKFWRQQKLYIGGFLMEKLKLEKEKL